MDPALLLGHLPRPILVLGRDMTVRLANAAFAGLLGAAGADATAVSALVRGFHIDGFWTALLASLFVSILSVIIGALVTGGDPAMTIHMPQGSGNWL